MLRCELSAFADIFGSTVSVLFDTFLVIVGGDLNPEPLSLKLIDLVRSTTRSASQLDYFLLIAFRKFASLSTSDHGILKSCPKVY